MSKFKDLQRDRAPYSPQREKNSFSTAKKVTFKSGKWHETSHPALIRSIQVGFFLLPENDLNVKLLPAVSLRREPVFQNVLSLSFFVELS
jgi:hypothetical protein